MCKFITVTANDDIDLAAFHRLTDSGFELMAGSAVSPKLPKGRLYFVHRGICDCGSAIGKTSHWPQGPYSEEELVELSTKEGSPAKIERWKRRRIDAHEKARPSPKDLQEISEWL